MSENLMAALVEIERYVRGSGWDQPARLFALVPTSELVAAEPALADQLPPGTPDGLSSIEQDTFVVGDDLGQTLAQIAWPPTVSGCALVLERAFLPPDAESDLPSDPQQAAQVVASHPKRLDLRIVVGVTRDGGHEAIARIRDESDGHGELLTGQDLVPALRFALARTLE